MEYALIAVLAYLVGSIPTGLIVARVTKGIDIRAYGSGKTGATNVLRTLGPIPFATVFAGDFAKGYIPIFLAGLLVSTSWAQVVAGLATLVGHNWSAFLNFSGGRGVATGIGGLFAVSPIIALPIPIVATLLIALTRHMSLGNIVGAALIIPLTILAIILGLLRPDYLLYIGPGALIVVYQHMDNISRLLKGTERKIGELETSPAGEAS
ncbi:MAG: glycerol-3-phosphate 1-O-acyltransferase PlsY [Chloroflexi bacterium]|nr:glycerol-3-phosphate 1-O-acyltransferase PlsY [Chloroflexota bacterium]